MAIEVTETTIGNILTRTGGFLQEVCSHSLQPYRGCSYGNSLCGVGCYVRHNGHVTRGRVWGSFLEVRTNAAASYLEHFPRESRWARRNGGRFSIFCSSSTDPFVPHERRYRVTHSVLNAMQEQPPDELILQTHSHRILDERDTLVRLSRRCHLRVQVSIESDRESLPGLPPPASSVTRRIEACARLRQAGLFVVITVAPLMPIADPEQFFRRIGEAADAVVLDHYIGGDGTPDGSRTLRTGLPAAIRAVYPEAESLQYRDEMAEMARRFVRRVGVHRDGFAGRYL